MAEGGGMCAVEKGERNCGDQTDGCSRLADAWNALAWH